MGTLYRYTSILLLVVLGWSCLGLGLGMITHQIKNSDDSVHVHQCCNTTEANGVHDMTDADYHHSTVPATIPLVLSVIFLIFVCCVTVTTKPSQHTSFQRLYIMLWERSLSYFALVFHRLFSRGLLHPKVW